MNNGNFVNAENLFLKYENEGKIIKDDNEKIIDVRHLNIKVPSFNKKTCKIEETDLSFIWKIKTVENLIELEFHDGKKVKTTPEHKFLTINENYEIVEKRSYELENKDFIISPRTLNYNSIDLKELELIFIRELSKDKGFFVYLNENFKKELHKKIIRYGRKEIWKEINSNLKFLSFYHGVWKGRYKLCDLIKVFNTFNIPLFDIYKNVSLLNYQESLNKEFKTSVYLRLPKNEKDWKDFFYLLGLLWGDGDTNLFLHSKDKQIQDEIKRICKNVFGTDVTLRISDKCPRLDLKLGLTFTKILTNLFNYPLKNKSGSIKFPELIRNLSKNLTSSFILGYFDTDGSVGVKHPVSISSKSKQFIEELQIVLIRFGCLSTTFKKDVYLGGKVFPQYVLNINGYLSTKNFKDNIGFNLQHKKNNLDKFLLNSQLSKKFDYLPYGNYKVSSNKRAYLQLEHNNLLIKQFLQQEIYFNKLKNKKEIENLDGYVFDFSVYGNENFIADGLIIHNTTFSDNLLLGAGMMSEELAGKQLALDFHEDEQERGITIDSANVSMVHTVDDVEHLINLIDTPGHVDFGGDVTRAMRAVDGAVVLVDAVEGIMPQTETVLKQALRERVKPILFINKVDRLIREVKLTPDKMQERFIKIINDVNRFIASIAPDEFKTKWQVAVKEGQVGFGSAFHNWALSIPFMEKTGITFKDVIEAYEEGENYKELAKKAPLHRVVLNMVVRHHPNPIQAQEYRIPKIWHGDLESKEGKSLLKSDPNGPIGFIVTKIVVDKHAGEVAAGRLFSGTLKQGTELWANAAKRKFRLQQVNIYKGASRFQVDNVPAGNIVGIVGLKDAFAGETVSSYEMEPFEAIKHLFEPVVSKSIEATKAADLPKLVEVLKQVNKEDPSIHIEINEETGENIMSGMGELHLEVIENRIVKEKGLQVKTSDPIVVYRETVLKNSIEFEGKSPNKHNKFFIQVEPLEKEAYDLIKAGEIPEIRVKKKDESVTEGFIKAGYDTKDAKRVKEIFNSCIFFDNTRGIVHIGEVMEMILDGFEQVIKEGPLAREPCMGIKVVINDMKLHEDAIHRGPAQVLPAVRDAIKEAMRNSGVYIFEPLQVLQIEAPVEYMGNISKLVQNRRGALLNMEQEGEHITISAKLPVGEMFGLTSELRSSTGGRGNFYVVDQVFEKYPTNMQDDLVRKIRQRKGLSENQ